MMFPDREDGSRNPKAKESPSTAGGVVAAAAAATHHRGLQQQEEQEGAATAASAAHRLGQRRRRATVAESSTNTNISSRSNSNMTTSPSLHCYSSLPLVHANHVEPPSSLRGAAAAASNHHRTNGSSSNKPQRKNNSSTNNSLRWMLQCALVITVVSRTFWHFYWLHHHRSDSSNDAAAVVVVVAPPQPSSNSIIHPAGFLDSFAILGAVPSGSGSRLLEKQSTAAAAATTTTTAVRGGTTTATTTDALAAAKNGISSIHRNKEEGEASLSSSLVPATLLDPWSAPQEDVAAPLRALQQRRRARRERTTPPPPPESVNAAAAVLQVHHPSQEVVIEIVHPPPPKEREEQQQQETLPQSSPHDWKALCEAAHLSSRSRVVITHIFSHPVGTAAALLLAQQCGVRHVLGADPLFPNLRQPRLRILTQHFKLAHRHIPDFRLLVPSASAGLGRRQNGLQWFPEFRPTHVLHLESWNGWCPDYANSEDGADAAAASTTTTAIDAYMSRQKQLLYHRRHSELALQQILQQALRGVQQQQQQPPVALLHVEHRVSGGGGGKPKTDTATTTTTDGYQRFHYPQQRQGHRILADTYHAVTGNVTLHSLELPMVYGPTVPATTRQKHCARRKNATTATSATTASFDDDDDDDDALLFVDDAVAAILRALSLTRDSSNEELLRMTVSVQTADASQQTANFYQRQDAAFQFHRRFPYGAPGKKSQLLDADAAQRYRDTYGIHPTRLPCATSCGAGGTASSSSSSSSTSNANGACEGTVFDGHVVAASRAATRSCPYAVYLVEFAADLEELFEPRQPPGGASNDALCRLAFVSGRSPLVDRALAEWLRQEKLRLRVRDDDDDDGGGGNATSTTPKSSYSAITRPDALKLYNGKIKSLGWTLIWLADHDESTLTDAEFALLRMEPSRFFAPSVKKAMFTESQAFAEPPDNALLRILSQIDRKAVPEHRVQERRSGVSVTRWVPKPAAKARAVALFVSESPYQPASVSEYGHLAANVTTLPRKQIVFYKQASHFVQTGQHRPEAHIRGSPYRTFPFQWISMGLLIHDLQLEQARTLRCSWLDEHLYWGSSNRYADELSFAWIVAQRRIEQSVGLNLEDDPSFVPFLQKTAEDDSDIEEEQMQRDVTQGGEAEVFVRIMKRSVPRPEPATEESSTQEQESSP